MPRLAGQIDVAKNEAILDATLDVFIDRGAGASMEEIARRAGVSKQTIYNHYGSKGDLVRAICARRVHELTAALDAPGALEQPEETVAAYGRALLKNLLNARSIAFMRAAISSAPAMPDLAQTYYEAGPRASRRKFAEFLAAETRAGRLHCPDAMVAAETFSGMVFSMRQLAALLGVMKPLEDDEIDRIARESAVRFMRLFGDQVRPEGKP